MYFNLNMARYLLNNVQCFFCLFSSSSWGIKGKQKAELTNCFRRLAWLFVHRICIKEEQGNFIELVGMDEKENEGK